MTGFMMQLSDLSQVGKFISLPGEIDPADDQRDQVKSQYQCPIKGAEGSTPS